jgi:hypothetical protein
MELTPMKKTYVEVSVEMGIGNPEAVFVYLSTADHLSLWTGANVKCLGKDGFIFDWSENLSGINYDERDEFFIKHSVVGERIRLQYTDLDRKDDYLEFKIVVAPITGDISVSIVDTDSSTKEEGELWKNALHRLKPLLSF